MKTLKIYQTLLIMLTLGFGLNAQGPCNSCSSADYDYQISSISFSGVDTENCIQEATKSTVTVTYFMNSPTFDFSTGAPAGSWYIQISFPQTGEYGYEEGNSIVGPDFDWHFDDENNTLRGYSNKSMVFGAGGDIEIEVTGLTENACTDVVTNVNAFTTLPNDVDGCSCLAAFQPDISNDAQTSSIGIAPAGALPVELTRFTAVKKERTSLLNWTTRLEIDNDRFEIERADDGKNYEKIGEVAGRGTTANVSNYEYVDEKPIQGFNYYRLKQLDKNGEFSYSEVRQLRFDGVSAGPIRVMPNPVSDFIQVDNLESNQIKEIMIYDESQRLIRTIQVGTQKSANRFNLSELNSGVYHLKFVGEQLVHTERIIKLSF